jgi:hypothetical protein
MKNTSSNKKIGKGTQAGVMECWSTGVLGVGKGALLFS